MATDAEQLFRPASGVRRSLLRDMKYSVIAVVAGISLATALGIYAYFLHQSERGYRGHLAEYTQFLGEALELPLWNMEDDLVRTICAAFAGRENIAELRVWNDKQQLLCAKRRTAYLQPQFTRRSVVSHRGQPAGEFEIALDAAYYEQRNRQSLIYNLATTVLVLTALVALLQYLWGRLLQRPMRSLIERIEGFAAGATPLSVATEESREFAVILDAFNDMAIKVRAREQSLHELNQQLHVEIVQRKRAEESLRQLNLTLARKVEEEVSKNREKDHILIQQSRLAAMGEMVHNIAHQWRQPLNALAIALANIQDDFEFHTMTSESLDTSVKRARMLIERMSTTIDDFRDFFRPDREPTEFDLGQAVEDALFVMAASLKNNNIGVVKVLPAGITTHGYPNQFAQAVLNLVANAKEAMQERQVTAGLIDITLVRSGERATLTIQDNAGGIAEEVLPRIFDPYFTTKVQGSGIGLYMTKMIIERNLKGMITVSNQGEGARFVVVIPIVVGVGG